MKVFPLSRLAIGMLCIFALASCDRTPQANTQPGAPPSQQSQQPPVAAPAEQKIDKMHPPLEVTTIDGKRYSLAQQRGKWTVVNFWATWCSPCLKEMPELSALDAMREHINVIGLAYEEITAADMQAFLAQHPVVYPIAIIDAYDPPPGFDAPRGLPMTYLIGPDGKIVETFMGPVTAKQIESAIADAGGPPIQQAPRNDVTPAKTDNKGSAA